MTGRGEGGGRRRRRLFDLSVDEDVGREVRFHIEMKVEELVAQGWTPDAARAEAERRFGDRAEVESECREIAVRHRRSKRRAIRRDTVIQDIRFGARALWRRPLFAVVAVLTLGLGVGANAAVFAVIQQLLLAPLPFPDADRIVRLWEVNARGNEIAFAEPNFFDVRERLRGLESVATHPTYWFGGPLTVLGGNRPVRRNVAFVSGDFFRVMRVPAWLGRVPGPEEARPGAEPVVVVSHAFWSDLLGGETDLSRLSVRGGSAQFAVIGVMPPGFRYPDGSDLWVPAEPQTGSSRTSHNFAVVGRLRDGVSLEDAVLEASALAKTLKAEHGDAMSAVDFRMRALRAELYGAYSRPLLLLLSAAAMVLLIACTNLASTLLAQASARRREFAVRSALGAGRARVIRQLFTESLLLAILGALAGALIAAAALRGIGAVAPSAVLQDGGFAVGAPVIGFALGASFLAALLFGLLPALRATHADVALALREGDRGGSARAGIWNALILSEAALAVILLVSSGLMLRSLRQTLDADPGFEARDIVVAELSAPAERYPNDTAVAVFHGRLLDAVRTAPGVQAAGLVSHLPFGGAGINGGLAIDGRPDVEPYADYRVASEGYFETLRIPVLRGRAFAASDRIGTTGVAVVSQSFVDRFLPDQDPIGVRLRDLSNDSWYYGRDAAVTIVGVVGDIRHRGFLSAPAPSVYVCSCQRALWGSNAALVLRTVTSAATIEALRLRLTQLEPDMPLEFALFPSVMRGTIADRRFSMLVMGAFSALALGLAALGVYGVVSYGVARRTREMGIRLALGARPARVASLIVRRAVLVVLAGVAIGSVGAIVAARLIESQLAGAAGVDPLTFLLSAAIIVIVALLASWVPARRIIRIDPLRTLRAE